jgi:hypothetical protein
VTIIEMILVVTDFAIVVALGAAVVALVLLAIREILK